MEAAIRHLLTFLLLAQGIAISAGAVPETALETDEISFGQFLAVYSPSSAKSFEPGILRTKLKKLRFKDKTLSFILEGKTYLLEWVSRNPVAMRVNGVALNESQIKNARRLSKELRPLFDYETAFWNRAIDLIFPRAEAFDSRSLFLLMSLVRVFYMYQMNNSAPQQWNTRDQQRYERPQLSTRVPYDDYSEVKSSTPSQAYVDYPAYTSDAERSPRIPYRGNESTGCPPEYSAAQCTVFTDTNRVRAEHGLAALRPSQSCGRLAQAHAEDMGVENKIFHDSPRFGSFVARAQRFQAPVKSENVLFSSGGEAAASEAVSRWMRSPDHKKNILDPNARSIGIGISVPTSGEGAGKGFFAQCFSSQ